MNSSDKGRSFMPNGFAAFSQVNSRSSLALSKHVSRFRNRSNRKLETLGSDAKRARRKSLERESLPKPNKVVLPSINDNRTRSHSNPSPSIQTRLNSVKASFRQLRTPNKLDQREDSVLHERKEYDFESESQVEKLDDGAKITTIGIGTAFFINRFIYRTKNRKMNLEDNLKKLEEQKARNGVNKMTIEVPEDFEEEPDAELRPTKNSFSFRSDGTKTSFRGGARSPFGGNKGGASLRDQILQKRRVSWDFLRNRLVEAKISDAFRNLKFVVNSKKFTSLRFLGEGGYAKVYEVYNAENELFALKVVDLAEKSESIHSDLMKEIQFLELFKDSERIVKMIDHDYNKEEKKLYVLLERGECDLQSIMLKLKEDNRLTPSKLRFYWEQMLEAVQEVHEKRIVHADLKPSNFLLVGGQLKVIDFGLAGEIPSGETFMSRSFIGGTKDYMSPEAMACYVIEDGAINYGAMKKSIDVKLCLGSDIWGLGIILYEYVYDGILPFSQIPGGKLAKMKATISPDIPVNLNPIGDPNLRETLRLCLQKSPTDRPSIEELLQHPYLHPFPT